MPISKSQLDGLFTDDSGKTMSDEDVKGLFGNTPPSKNGPAALSSSGNILSHIVDLSHGAAKGAIKGIEQGAEGLVELGGGIEETIGMKKAAGQAKEGAAALEEASKDPRLQAKNATEGAGEVIGQAADLAVPAPKVGEAAGVVKEVASPLAEKVAQVIGKKTIDKTEESLMPRLTAKVAEKEGGTDPKGVMGNINRIVSKATKKIAATVKAAVPEFEKLKTYTQKANAVADVNTKEAENLEKMVEENNHPYTFKELNSAIKNIEKPELVKTGDKTVQRLYDSARSKMLSLARKNGGDMSGLLKSRKEFYSWVNKEYKNLWGSDQITAAREGISAIAQATNKFIADGVEAAQPGAGDAFKQSLSKQTDLFDAEDILREKAARGAPEVQGEIGTNRFQRFAENHPGLVKGAKNAALVAGGSVLAGETVKHGL